MPAVGASIALHGGAHISGTKCHIFPARPHAIGEIGYAHYPKATCFEGRLMEHRWGRRQSSDLMVRFYIRSGTTGIGRLLNISSTGAYMATTAHLRPFSLVYLEPAAASFWEIQSRRIAASVVREDAGGVGLEWCESAAEATKVSARLTALAGSSDDAQRSSGRRLPTQNR
jgi:hypothetical protein